MFGASQTTAATYHPSQIVGWRGPDGREHTVFISGFWKPISIVENYDSDATCPTITFMSSQTDVMISHCYYSAAPKAPEQDIALENLALEPSTIHHDLVLKVQPSVPSLCSAPRPAAIARSRLPMRQTDWKRNRKNLC